ncbi:ABC transporter substrate-binding protein [Puniceibacterium sediminis]|uniref:Iron complex transport system substrate-binding protein n=1 Tax=Puniceibacterium sediminis TaxID=1608407 RepID=A0A238Z305_9RHOB|nr:ABC transporter substrate-binding protein [Puniceibacterium sediminis]SNR77331.1 iron complex transport system substrate-binding protein [Puniceibacterium sediminis]
MRKGTTAQCRSRTVFARVTSAARTIAWTLFATLPAGVCAADTLPRVVSMNLCTDQLVLLLADPDQILSLSRLAGDPRSSSMMAEAAAYPLNTGAAEEIFALNPDVVLAGRYSDPTVLAMLRRLGLRVEQIPITAALNEIPELIRTVGAMLQQDSRAERLAGEVAPRIAAYGTPSPDAPVAAFFYPNGYSLGADTLSHEIVSAAGFRNLSEALGMTGGGRLALEQLVAHAPDVLISAPRYPGHSRSEDLSFHPVLARYSDEGRLIFSTSDWVCGTPFSLRAVDTVATARAALERDQ